MRWPTLHEWWRVSAWVGFSGSVLGVLSARDWSGAFEPLLLVFWTGQAIYFAEVAEKRRLNNGMDRKPDEVIKTPGATTRIWWAR